MIFAYDEEVEKDIEIKDGSLYFVGSRESDKVKKINEEYKQMYGINLIQKKTKE